MYPANTQTLKIANGPATLHVLFSPKPGAETVLILHGGPGTPDDMPEVAALLAPNYQLLYFDQRGSGGSACTAQCTYSVAEHVSDIAAIMEDLKIEKLHIFGHSWGGLLAQLFALQHPDKILSLFLCSPAAGTGLIWRQMELEMTLYGMSRSSPAEWPLMMYNILMGTLGANEGARHFFRKFHEIAHRGFPATAPGRQELELIRAEPVNKIRNQVVNHPPLPTVLQAAYPVSISYSEFDTDIFRYSRQHVLNRFPSAQKMTIPGAGHFPWLHNLPEFERALGRHFKIGKQK